MRPGAERLTLRLTALAVLASVSLAHAQAPSLVEDARVAWISGNLDFGGFSGIEVLDGGAGFLAISDRGHWATGRLRRENGILTGVETTGFGPLREISGKPLDGDNVDAEGLALASDGAAYVSFEAFHRIRRYDPVDGPAENFPSPRDFAGLQRNSGLEALAIDQAGTLYAIPERSGKLDRPFPVFRYRNGTWDADLGIRRDGAFLVTGADFGPDGRLYVLERDFRWLGGFSNRVRRFDLGPDGFTNEVTLLELPFGGTDNFEGISVWRDGSGAIRATLVSDDNFFPLQQTAIAEYVLRE
jgi:hypothetical protein